MQTLNRPSSNAHTHTHKKLFCLNIKSYMMGLVAPEPGTDFVTTLAQKSGLLPFY